MLTGVAIGIICTLAVLIAASIFMQKSGAARTKEFDMQLYADTQRQQMCVLLEANKKQADMLERIAYSVDIATANSQDVRKSNMER